MYIYSPSEKLTPFHQQLTLHPIHSQFISATCSLLLLCGLSQLLLHIRHLLLSLSRHVVFAPSSLNAYGSSVFPGVVDTIFEAVNYGGSWDEVRRQLDIVRVHIHHAIQVLSYPSLKYVART